MSKTLSKGSITLITIGIVILILIGGTLTTYNGLVSKDEAASTAWSNLQAQYQRRADLVPNLVNTVKGYAKHESETFENVVAARAKATQLSVDADNLTPERARQILQAQGDLSTAHGKLMAISESYPELKASENFSELQAQLEGTENRIAESRRLYNESVQTFNTAVRRFPANIVAGIFGFEKKSKFEAQESAANAPQVEF